MKHLWLMLILAGCATPQAQGQQEQAYVAALQQRCSAYGFNAGTDAFADCVRREHLCERQMKDARVRQGLAQMDAASKPGSSYGRSAAAGVMARGPVQCF